MDVKVRVLNKSKDGVVIKYLALKPSDVPGGVITDKLTWDEFNESFDYVDGFIYKLKKELVEKEKEEMEFLQTKAFPIYLLAKTTNEPDSFSRLAHISDEYCKKYNRTPLEFINKMKIVNNFFYKSMLDLEEM